MCACFPTSLQLCSQEVSREIHSHRPLDMLQDMAYCAAASRVAIGGGSTVKLLDVSAEYGEVQNESTELPAGHVVNQLAWGQDGQVRRTQLGVSAVVCLWGSCKQPLT